MYQIFTTENILTDGSKTYDVVLTDTEWGEDADAGSELYDHQTDPNEWNNLAHSKDSRHRSLVRRLSEQMRRQ